jgi:hypothetical protein
MLLADSKNKKTKALLTALDIWLSAYCIECSLYDLLAQAGKIFA